MSPEAGSPPSRSKSAIVSRTPEGFTNDVLVSASISENDAQSYDSNVSYDGWLRHKEVFDVQDMAEQHQRDDQKCNLPKHQLAVDATVAELIAVLRDAACRRPNEKAAQHGCDYYLWKRNLQHPMSLSTERIHRNPMNKKTWHNFRLSVRWHWLVSS